MNLTPTEIERLTIFMAAQFARRNRSLGIRLSHPEAVALIIDEVMVSARLGVPYQKIRDMAGRLLTTDDVMPGVASMIRLIIAECPFPEGTKLMAIFDPVGPGSKNATDELTPGEIITPEREMQILADRVSVKLEVVNMGDRDIQVRSHAHFFESNRKLKFNRAEAWGMKLDVIAGAGVRFEPGIPKIVSLIPLEGKRIVLGQAGLVNGSLDDPGALKVALERARTRGYLGA